ncbi:MAG: GDSL-type esterase/lipase family protein [Myxococcota bacterium]
MAAEVSVDPALEQPIDDHPAGVYRLAYVVAFAALSASVPYLTPGLERFQVWAPGDPIPFAGLIELWPTPRAGSSIGGAIGASTVSGQSDEALLSEAPLPSPLQNVQVSRAQEPPTTEVSILKLSPSEYEGLTQDIEDPDGVMRHFYGALHKVHAQEPGALARLSFYGTSTNGADRVTHVLREQFNRAFGDGGKGWIPIAPGWQYQVHQDVSWSHRSWRTSVVNRGTEQNGRYGLGGVLARNAGIGSRASFGTADADGELNRSVSRFILFYQAYPEGGSLVATVEGREPRTLSTAASEVEDRTLEIPVPGGSHTLKIGVDEGRLKLYGVVMEGDGPGVVVDGLMLIGAFTRVLLNFDSDHIAEQVRQRGSDLLVFWMGANDAVSTSVPYERDEYVRRYATILERFRRARADLSCIVMSVLDKGVRNHGRIRTRDRVPDLVDAQREAARTAGCAFFNTYEAIGGAGTMRRWYRHQPRLVTADLGHLTAPGSRIVGTLFYKALVKGYGDWLAENP